MTNGEKIEEITGRKPFIDDFGSPYMIFSKKWWDSEYEESEATNEPKLFNGCAVCDKHEVCPDAFCSHSVHCNAYGIPNFHKGNENGNTYTCCGSCYLCDVDDCEAKKRKGGVE